MAIPINIKTLLSGKVVEWERLDFKRGWNPVDVVHSVCAFANDVNNWGGGYIVVGIDENNGMPILPPVGLNINEIDKIQKELVNIVHQIDPNPVVITEPIDFQGKTILVIWVPGGELRPYKAPSQLGKEAAKQGKRYYIRNGSVTCVAQDEEEHRLMALASKVPFDDRLCHEASEDDLNLMLIRDYLRKVHSNITDDEAIRMPFRDLCWSLQLIGGTTEYIRPKNFALLFFNDDPEKFIPYARIETVMFQDDIGDKFEEKIFHGPLHKQYDEVMGYLRSRVVSEKVIKVNNQAEAIRAFNYPYAALEEVVANAIYHKSYDDRNPIEIRINLDSIQVYSLEGPMPPLRASDLKKQRVVSRNYRNRRIGDILKDMDITEGRSTGFPKVYNALKKNGSPEPVFETDDRNSYFLATIPIHPAFDPANAGMYQIVEEETEEKTKEKTKEKIKEKTKEKTKGKMSLKNEPKKSLKSDPISDPISSPVSESGPKSSPKTRDKMSLKSVPKTKEKSREKTKEKTKEKILFYLSLFPTSTQETLQKELGLSRSGVEYILSQLKKEGRLQREGSRRNGTWIVVINKENK